MSRFVTLTFLGKLEIFGSRNSCLSNLSTDTVKVDSHSLSPHHYEPHTSLQLLAPMYRIVVAFSGGDAPGGSSSVYGSAMDAGIRNTGANHSDGK